MGRTSEAQSITDRGLSSGEAKINSKPNSQSFSLKWCWVALGLGHRLLGVMLSHFIWVEFKVLTFSPTHLPKHKKLLTPRRNVQVIMGITHLQTACKMALKQFWK